MKYVAVVLLFWSSVTPARGQSLHSNAAAPLSLSFDQSAFVLRSPAPPLFTAPITTPGRALGLTPYLEGLRAPTRADELPAFVLTPSGERPVDLYSTRPTSVGGWLVRAAAETICQNSAQGSAPCGAIGDRPYSYPRFRSVRYE